jgi:hypothetical protein
MQNNFKLNSDKFLMTSIVCATIIVGLALMRDCTTQRHCFSVCASLDNATSVGLCMDKCS